ncbi:MAG: hypothetical protein IT480_12335 [Gammaproteobacteria bacterium]|nr:hypothetical protein [Gammaproteobacteria bacterium]
MKGIVLTALAATAAFSFALPAHAGKGGPAPTATITKQKRNDNKAFVGINWNWGVRDGATVVVGYRWARVNGNGRVNGSLIDLTFPLSGADFGLGELHVKGLTGQRSAQVELGVGYGFQGDAFLLNGGARGPYVNLGTDYLFGKGWQPYVGIDTLGHVKRPKEITTLSCPEGYTLQGNSCISDGV